MPVCRGDESRNEGDGGYGDRTSVRAGLADLARECAGDLFRVESAGCDPAGYVRPLAIEVMAELGMEIGAFDGVSANMMLDRLFTHPESRICCIDPFLPDPTTPEVSERTRKDFYENLGRGGHREQIEISEGLSVEVLAWMIAEEGYWDSFDFIYIDGSHLGADVLTDAVMSWNLLKYGGVIAFDDYEWQPKRPLSERPKAGIDAFESVFGPELRLVKDGYRRIWQKVGGVER